MVKTCREQFEERALTEEWAQRVVACIKSGTLVYGDEAVKSCPKCKGRLESFPDLFYFRGRSYSMDFCSACNSTWGLPEEFKADVSSGVFDRTIGSRGG